MTLQNRVDPWGKLNSVATRGAWLGNRGILHNEHKQITAQWRHKNWVTCQLGFENIQRKVFSAGNYSELFFLDEATAFAAGHRPCFACRRARYNEFKTLWCQVNLEATAASAVSIDQIDQQLHAERAAQGGGKVTFTAEFKDVPEGAFIELNGIAYLLWLERLQQWSPQGYTKSDLELAPSEVITVLTPASIVRLFQHDFKPQVHESAYC